MKAKPNATSSLVEGRSLASKYEVHNHRSGEVSNALRSVLDGAELYEKVQQSEVVLHAAKTKWDAQAAAFLASRAGEEKLRKQLLDMCRAAVSMSEAEEIPGLRDILVCDANDETSIAARLAEGIKAAPRVGTSISETLVTLRNDLLAKEVAHQEITNAFDLATREFGHAYYRATSIVAQGKAVLFLAGIKIADKKIPKKKKPAVSKSPEVPLAA